MEDLIILVDKNDKEIGYEEKLKAHQNGGKLHRAFSVFAFNSKGETLLQLRSRKKYHFGGLWTNTCCSHPRKGESLEKAVHRRLKEEFGFDCGLKEVFSFIYRADSKNGLSEHEYDHVFVGDYEGKIKPNPEEISDYKWMSLGDLGRELEENEEAYTPWLKIAYKELVKHV